MGSGNRRPLRHAWVTGDGTTAIDPTWRKPEHMSYFGTVFPTKGVAMLMLIRGHYRILDPLDAFAFQALRSPPGETA
jgi:hypothetical protein